MYVEHKVRSTRQGVLQKKGILKNSAELTGKQMCAGVYNEGAGFMDKVKILRSHFIQRRCFPVKFAKFLIAPLRTAAIL